jgi:hypothetical protein
VYLNQLFHGDNVLEGSGIYKESTTTGYTLSSAQVYILENDVSTAATALAAKDLTGLAWDVTAESKYLFTYIGNVSPNLATTGCGFSLSLGGGSGNISMGFHHKSGTGDTGGGSSISDGGVLNTSASFPGTGNYPIIGHGTVDITAGVPITIQLRIHPEVNDVVIARAGFALIVTRLTAT